MKDDLIKAFEMLREAFPDRYVQVEIMVDNFASGNEMQIRSQAFLSGTTPGKSFGKSDSSPIEAARDLIRLAKEHEEGVENEPTTAQ